MDQSEVVERVNEWESRLNGLFFMLRQWYDKLPSAGYKEFLTGSYLQTDEGMLNEFEVHPRMLPHCAILYGQNRLSFVPGPLWTVGTNGRVYAVTSKRQFVLVDLGGNGKPSNWQILTSQLQGTYRPFTEAIFRELVQHQELNAA